MAFAINNNAASYGAKHSRIFWDIASLDSGSGFRTTLGASAVQLKTQIGKVSSNRSIFRGQSAEAMSAYLTEVHGTILTAWQNCLAYYRNVTEKYVRDLRSVDEAQDAIIELDYLEDFAHNSVAVVQSFNELEGEVATFFSTYAEFLNGLFQPQAEPVASHLANAQKLAKEQAWAMGKQDYHYTYAMENINNILTAIKATMTTFTIGTGSINYSPGDFPGTEFYQLMQITDDMVDRLSDRFFHGDSLDHFAMGNVIAMGHEYGMSDLELRVLLNLLGRDSVTLQDIVEAYGMAYAIALVNQNPGRFHLYSATTGGDLRSFVESLTDDALLFQMQLENTDSVALQQLADALAGQVMEEVTRLNSGGRPIQHTDIDNLQSILQQAQLLAFLNDIGLVAPASAFNLDNFGGRPGGHIIYRGNQYIVSGVFGLVGGSYTDDRVRNILDLLQSDLDRAIAESGLSFTDFWGLIGYAVINAPGYIPGVGKYYSLAVTSYNITSYIVQIINNAGIDLGPQQQAIIDQMVALSTSNLGGGLATVQLPGGGYHIIDTTLATPEALINIAILENQGISLDQALMMLREPTGSESLDRVINYLASSSPERNAFTAPLRNLLSANIDDINREFGLNLADNTPLEDLPLNVLEYLIALSRGTS